MRWFEIFLHSNVARRIFGVFIICALLPISALTFISFRQVTEQLERDARLQLRQAAKSEGAAMYERLEFLVDDLGTIASGLRGASEDANPYLLGGVGRDTSQLFQGIAVITPNGDLQTLFGNIETLPGLSDAQIRHLEAGSAVLVTFPCAVNGICPRLLRYVDPSKPSRGLLIGDPQPAYLWDGDKLPPSTKVCVIDENGQPVYCSDAAANEIRAAIAGSSGSAGTLEWGFGKNSFLAGYSTVLLRTTLHSPSWTVVLSQSREDVLAPLRKFSRAFLPLILVTVFAVMLLSFVQIRRSMFPLQQLEKGTRQIANGNFDTRVKVSTNDEFRRLGECFNRMADELDHQFRALETVSDIDRAILSSLDRRDIVNRVLRRVRALLSQPVIAVTMLDCDQPDRAVTYIAPDDKQNRIRIVGNTLSRREVEELQLSADRVELDLTGELRSYLEAVASRGAKFCIMLPIRHEDQLFGVLILGNGGNPDMGDDLAYAKQLADRLAVGLSNAQLVEELDKLNIGTLTALARAIDAKSTWTAGHSERVTRMAVDIGRAMALPEKDLLTLHRGGLLHDIGKIGTPPEILDKPDKLSESEVGVMCEHVTVGARILEPIPGFAELIPIVVQHHERFDGSGYPFGLAGEAIHLHARIFAVADVYDALSSDRPYRPGWARDRVIAYIREKSGTHFDPRVVDAFLKVMALVPEPPKRAAEAASFEGTIEEGEKRDNGASRHRNTSYSHPRRAIRRS
ncbi:MAG TPA: HD domain-containing phosphohydrolase [Terriglobales bacterium]|nr:HD domain-containing phosphohydrolase [Terriglobales bacterium]